MTFSLDVDVLAEKGKEMMKMTFFDVEEDKIEGGFKIVPQNMRYSYTPFAQD
ncbi:MAG: hypothetical protein LUC37_00965 [Prevotella sp.]|nr:hypothetical protein [Prevotella sp.]